MRRTIRNTLRVVFWLAGFIGALFSTGALLEVENLPTPLFFLMGILAMWPMFPWILVETAIWVARRSIYDAPISYYDRHLKFWHWARHSLAPVIFSKREIMGIKKAERRQEQIQRDFHHLPRY